METTADPTGHARRSVSLVGSGINGVFHAHRSTTASRMISPDARWQCPDSASLLPRRPGLDVLDRLPHRRRQRISRPLSDQVPCCFW